MRLLTLEANEIKKAISLIGIPMFLINIEKKNRFRYNSKLDKLQTKTSNNYLLVQYEIFCYTMK